MSHSNDELYKWFNKFTHIKLELIVEDAQKNGKLNYNECNLLRTIASYSRRGDKPTTKQIEYAKKILEKYNSDSVNMAEEVHYAQLVENNKGKATNDVSHLTVRIAWHDNKWNGKICNSPELNDYCIGEHSLLSERLRTRRNTSLECKMCSYDLDKVKKEGYQPPCFWGINAFGNISAEIEHDNPAAPNVTHIREQLTPYSVFTWPFKLSFVREKSDEQKYGKYYPDRIFENRISHFQSKFKEKKSIVFLYTNYDNPVSGDEQKYLVVGCALMKDRGEKQYFDIQRDELAKLRNRPGAQNFPTMNWALRYSLDFPENGVLLPYHEYLELEENNQNGEKDLLNQIKVTIDEPELVSGFKYVAMDIGNDQSIFILTKIKRSLLIIKEHALVDYDVDNSLMIIDDMLRMCWNQRGHFPGFSKLSRVLFDIRQNEKSILDELVHVLQENEGKKYFEKLIEMMEDPDSIDERYDDYEDLIYDLNDAIEEHDITSQDFLRLAMLDLTYDQFKRIVNSNIFSLKDVCENPYVLYEDYIPSSVTEDANNGDVIDGNIDLYKIDIAYFPISDYIKKIRKLQNIRIDDPRRIRALIISILKTLEGKGDCFEEAEIILDRIRNYPLFYKADSELIFKQDLRNLDDKYIEHLVKKITIKKDKNGIHSYYYLNEINEAEIYIKSTIKNILELPDNNDLNKDMREIINQSVEGLSKRLKHRFDKETYISEHTALYSNVFKKRLFVLTGSPGSGKSHELLRIITKLKENYGSYLLLTPTGKAALRLKTDPEFKNINAMTIDKYLNNDDENMLYENIIIDEMSMVDLIKFKELLQNLNLKPTNFKRLILVGDPHQLPPIGYGKVFVDIIDYIKSDNKYRNNHISLTVNCRQETDTMILDLANVFADKNKNFEELFSRLKSPGQLSSGLFIDFWKNRSELQEKIISHFRFLFEKQYGAGTGQLTTIIDNLLGFGNSEKNYKSNTTLNLEAFQILSPYRSGYFGTLGLNNYLQQSFRTEEKSSEVFRHGDKIILTKNIYEKGKLVVSNGSIGLAVKNGYKVKQYFPEYGGVRKFDSEKLELGYAITVHKSQGSGFNHVFVVIPNKRALLSKELLYTALTRSRNSLSIFIYQDSENDVVDLFEEVRNRSYISHRRTSIFHEPTFNDTYLPANGISVKSRVEYIIYKKLEHYQNSIGGFSFKYEEVYELNNGKFDIKPDFTIELLSGRKIYWEHLGRLTDKSYVGNWKSRLDIYKQKGELGNLITTDELNGISDEKISLIIEDILGDNIRGEGNNIWYSKYHYSLNS
ncbi:AAA family ATPase [Bacillus sp. S/N-304-OC-R1]|uniref:AAA family ATPase n=1 Tax=Bacillus sp. S/N-304-OC-R1 TaxID=2758034 RepID=UPI001C8E7717|nr:AAA family ATPase [Bacillus sp. S/N-304-OC-R1]MBY0124401.1 AAA family ATPase [Bacillus sp. S/N-304-OC-R1]